MTLDELEKWAEDWRREMPLDRHPSFAADELATALRRYLPMIRAAEAWRDYGPGQSHCDEEDCPCTSAECQLKHAITTARGGRL